jgi:hypothetical protein
VQYIKENEDMRYELEQARAEIRDLQEERMLFEGLPPENLRHCKLSYIEHNKEEMNR